ncbi:hypothetical protein CAC42_2158 [Sphaceloma murrayae]|uniref:WW domain-containing protein n=1 Tax=Sphaceloma murrayae TaxID=2082308 RepID=A0A2K1QJ62_9PEZI|nr:hypothetical protein CAC42_2158 [Sphaceloma murrayae]
MDEPPLKKHKSASPAPSSAPLPPGWSEHTAPSGHKYFYHKASKKSTYTRPILAPPPRPDAAPPAAVSAPQTNGHGDHGAVAAVSQSHSVPHTAQQAAQYHAYSAPDPPGYGTQGPGHFAPGAYQQSYPPYQLPGPSYARQAQQAPRPPRQQPHDRPKRKEIIPNCSPWILVYTRLGRRFVHNTRTRESFWKFPQDVMTAVIKFDQIKLAEKYGEKKDETDKEPANKTPDTIATKPAVVPAEAQRGPEIELSPAEVEAHKARETARLARELEEDTALVRDLSEERIWVPPATGTTQGYDSSEYEEVEVTDSEYASSNGDPDDAPPETGPLEFNEDDIAFQLAALGEEYGLDPAEYGSGASDEEDGAEGLPISDEERYAVFAEMLGEYAVSPYTPWESLISDETPHAILLDERFTVVPSGKGRREAHGRWCKEEIARVQKEREERKGKGQEEDVKAVFEGFLRGKEKEVRKLYWVEFRRKYKRAPEMKGDRKFGEKEMEKVYREMAAALKKGK